MPVALCAKQSGDVEGCPGIGGQMNETEDQTAVVVEPPGKEAEKPKQIRSGAESFRSEADRVLQSDGKKIAEALATEAKKGISRAPSFCMTWRTKTASLARWR